MKKNLIIVLVVFISACSTRDNLDIKDYPIVTTISELSEYYDLKIDTSGKYETASITSYFDGSTELEYAYELLESEKYDPLYYSITIDKDRTIKDAKEVYLLGKGALKLVGNSFGQGAVKIDSIKLPGDNSYYALRTLDGEPNGMFYIVRKGKKVYTMMVSGIYTPDHSLLKDLLIPKTKDLDRFEFVK
ncbi:MAG: hypothetical protein QNK89_10470 [Lacinutrix sp.]|uniref:hypothetical protein n=1 Tax=Lacinutrix sp. TaxID=1937692 RepID=UPI00309816F5